MSTQKQPMSVTCPTCSKKILWNQAHPFRPFCSERCKLIDLGAWAEEKYRVPASPSDTSMSAAEDHDQDEQHEKK